MHEEKNIIQECKKSEVQKIQLSGCRVRKAMFQALRIPKHWLHRCWRRGTRLGDTAYIVHVLQVWGMARVDEKYIKYNWGHLEESILLCLPCFSKAYICCTWLLTGSLWECFAGGSPACLPFLRAQGTRKRSKDSRALVSRDVLSWWEMGSHTETVFWDFRVSFLKSLVIYL